MTEAFYLPKGLVRFEVKQDGKGFFSVKLLNEDDSPVKGATLWLAFITDEYYYGTEATNISKPIYYILQVQSG